MRQIGVITRRLAQEGRTALRAPVHSLLLPAGACILVPVCALTALALPPTTVERLTSPFLGDASTAARLGDLPLALPLTRRGIVTAGSALHATGAPRGVGGRTLRERGGVLIPEHLGVLPMATDPELISRAGAAPSAPFHHGVNDDTSLEPDLTTPPTAGSDETPAQGADPGVGIEVPAMPGGTGPAAPESGVPSAQDPVADGGAAGPGDVVDPPTGAAGSSTEPTDASGSDSDTRSDSSGGTAGSDPTDCGPPGRTGQNPGLGGVGAPGQTGTNPGQCDNGNGNGNGNETGSDGTTTDTDGTTTDTAGAPDDTTTTVCGPPGQTGQNPGLGGVGAPGQTGTNPGQCDNGNGNETGNGNDGTPADTAGAPDDTTTTVCGPPGQTGQNPGLGGVGAPGQTGTNPGQCTNGNANGNGNGNGKGKTP